MSKAKKRRDKTTEEEWGEDNVSGRTLREEVLLILLSYSVFVPSFCSFCQPITLPCSSDVKKTPSPREMRNACEIIWVWGMWQRASKMTAERCICHLTCITSERKTATQPQCRQRHANDSQKLRCNLNTRCSSLCKESSILCHLSCHCSDGFITTSSLTHWSGINSEFLWRLESPVWRIHKQMQSVFAFRYVH